MSDALYDWQLLGFVSALASAVFAAALFLASVIRPARRSGGPMLVLVVGLLASVAVLVPEQSAVALGLEIAVLGLALGIVVLVEVTTGPGLRGRLPSLLPALPAVALVVGGLVIETGSVDAGLYWVFAGVTLGIVVALGDAWRAATSSDG
jgi:modulator of FtsH protease